MRRIVSKWDNVSEENQRKVLRFWPLTFDSFHVRIRNFDCFNQFAPIAFQLPMCLPRFVYT